ncbi:hypothetical protein CDAR_205381 [Caerostris darwini]|uniref:Uncharacterized protein n=1 Tax=Caerostris darwini TaxID=1538125 RepID=A0AAV4WTK4_9ARAC|nr:hypothetical protein CDAR_205381 [Caerostris darwini]
MVYISIFVLTCDFAINALCTPPFIHLNGCQHNSLYDRQPLESTPFFCALPSPENETDEISHMLLPLNQPNKWKRQIPLSHFAFSNRSGSKDYSLYFPKGKWGKKRACIKSSWGGSACLSSSLVLPIQFSCFKVPSSFTFIFIF